MVALPKGLRSLLHQSLEFEMNVKDLPFVSSAVSLNNKVTLTLCLFAHSFHSLLRLHNFPVPV